MLRDNKIDLFVAIENYNKTKSMAEIIQLINSGADLTAKNSDNNTPMQVLRDANHWECINVIAGMKKTDKKDKARYGDVFLTAVKNDKLDTAIILIEAGANLTWYSQDNEYRSLHWAVKNRNLKMLELLIKSGADLSQVNKENQTPIQLAASLGFWDCVKTIADNKKSDENDALKYTEILFSAIKAHQASESNLIDTIKALIDAGANLAGVNVDKYTPIQLARSLTHWDCVAAIAKTKKADSNDTQKYGDPLIIVVSKNDYDTAKILLEAGASTTWNTTDDGYRCLHWAIKHRNIKMIELLLKYNADLTSTNKDKKTPIQLAAELEYWDCVEAIAKKKDSDEKGAANYGGAMLTAVKKCQLNTVKVLIKAKAPATWHTISTKMTCLHEAVSQDNNLEVVQLLLNHGVNLASINNDDHTPIELAARKKQWAYVEAIANSQKIDEKDVGRYGAALYFAVYYDCLTTTELLLKAKAPITWHSPDTKNRLLHAAVINNSPKMIELLLKHGSDLHGLNKEGQTPLELACSLGKWDCVDVFMRDKTFKFRDGILAGMAYIDAIKAGRLDVATYLLNAGASPIECTKADGLTALHWAVNQNNRKAVSYLLERKASQADLSKNDETPIELATRLEYWDCAQDLLEHDSVAVAKNKSNLIEALHYENALLNTIKAGNYNIANLLLEHRAPCYRSNSEWGNIALYWAVKGNNPAIIELLTKYGADPTVKNKDAKTLHALARELGHMACVKALDKSNKDELACDIVTITSKRDGLFEMMMENAVAAADLPSTIHSIKEYNHHILKNDVAELGAHREALRSQANQSSPSTYANLLSNKQLEIENINTLIKAMNTLIKFPDSGIPTFDLYIIGEMQKQGSEEADHVMIVFNQIQKINAYVLTITKWLDQLEKKINATAWKVKNFFGSWVDGIPDNIQSMKNELLKINSSSTSSDIINIYSEVIKIFSAVRESNRRHASTAQFYNLKRQEFERINFADSQLIGSTQYPFATNVQYQSGMEQISSIYQPYRQQPSYQMQAGEFAGAYYPLPVQESLLPVLPPTYEAAMVSRTPSIYPQLPGYSSYQPEAVQDFAQEYSTDLKMPLFPVDLDNVYNLSLKYGHLSPNNNLEQPSNVVIPQVDTSESLVVEHAAIESQQNDLSQREISEPETLINTLNMDEKQLAQKFPLVPKHQINIFKEANHSRDKSHVDIKQHDSQTANTPLKQFAT